MDSLSAIDKNIYEIIIINDGSQDDSETICNQFKDKHNNTFVIHKENEGVSIARNYGILNAQGQYVTFVDSDDFVNNAFVQILSIIKNFENIDVFQFGYTRIDRKEKVIKRNNYKRNALISLKDEKLSNDFTFIAAVWCKVYCRNFLIKNNIFFRGGRTNSEDIEFNFNVWSAANKIYLSKVNYYMYLCDRKNSNMNSYSVKHYNNQLIPVLLKCNEMLLDIQNNERLSKSLFNFLVAHSYNGLDKVVRVANKEELSNIISVLRNNKFLVSYPKSLPISGKMFWVARRVLGIKISAHILHLILGN